MKKRVLIIEDNEQNIYMLTYLLESQDFQVIQARSGVEGIEMAIESKPDFILLDIQLPEMDGYTVAAKIRECEILKQIPIIVVTSYAMTGDKEKALASGADGYIEKPIDPETFIDQMNSFLPSHLTSK
ncbi:MAG: response regulator [Ignavibacteriales bacterium]|nr:response regulator [Ignavibacteriales bacterium]HOJ17780.1 response regulator [Ignavibacteriaceae bacterium]HPO55075.1 response regulator [Ignavibacteriaceae bacterium]